MSSSSGTAKGTSLQQFLTPLIINFVIFGLMVSLFIALRKRYPRIYEPKAIVRSIPHRRQTNALPPGAFSWLMPLAVEVDTVLLQKAGLDGYFFLRYMKFMFIITLAGCVILWPVLFPVYATGPAGQTGLDVISISNISGSSGRFYAPILMGWIFIALICFGIYREYQHYLLVRHEYITSPAHSRLPQATTVLITQIPETHLSQAAMEKAFEVYPGGVKQVYFNQDLSDLEDSIKTRDKIAYKLEAAQTKLIKVANKLNSKKSSTNKEDARHLTDSERNDGSTTRFVPEKKRPHHKLGFLGLFGKKVDTIKWCSEELARLNPEIAAQQADTSKYKLMNACFVQFHSQAAAQMCFQAIASGNAMEMQPRYTEIAPHDVVWSNMNLTWKSRMLKGTLATTFVVALIIFWTIPVAFVGVVSNITYLTEKVKFLRFINNCPEVLLGLITAYLPTIMLAVLMALLPIILRLCAKQSGIPTRSGIEYAVSNSYFTFLVVQSFLVVTVVGSATAAVTQIIDDPSSATSILAAKLPTASNFYIAYILLQGLAIASGALAQIVGLILFFVLGKLLDSTPRKKWARWNNLVTLKFGTVYPIYAFLAMISLTYSLISPLILVFSAFTFGAFYLAYKYNFLYVYALQTSTLGLLYPRALQQTLVGVYFLEVCMIGLVAVGKSWGSIVLMVVALVATILFHIKLNTAFGPLLDAIPITMANRESEPDSTELNDMRTAGYHDFHEEGRDSPFRDPEQTPGSRTSMDSARKTMQHRTNSSSDAPPSYQHEALTSKCPSLWLPGDSLGVASQEAERTRRDAKMTVQETGAFVDEKGNLTWDNKTDPFDYDSRIRDVEL